MKFWFIWAAGFLVGFGVAFAVAAISELHFWGYGLRDAWRQWRGRR